MTWPWTTAMLAGPLHRLSAPADTDIPNLGTVLHRLAPHSTNPDAHTDLTAAVLTWLHNSTPPGLLPELRHDVLARRAAALDVLAARAGHARLRIVLRPAGRFALNLGDNATPLRLGVALHGTYGWPVVRGSGLKGVARTWVSDQPGHDPAQLTRVLGPDPCEADQCQPSAAGTVTIFDGLPADETVRLVPDVVTPHHPDFSAQAASGRPARRLGPAGTGAAAGRDRPVHRRHPRPDPRPGLGHQLAESRAA